MTPRHSGSSTRNETKQRGIEGGFPHSEILGSKRVRSSPRLIAAYHVLHRLSAPRHPPNALKTLDRSHDPCAHPSRGTAHGPRTGPSRARRATGAVSCPCEPEDPHGQIKTRDDRRGTEAPPDRHLCRTRPGDRRCRRRWCPRRVHPLHDVKHRRRSGHEDHEQRRTLLSTWTTTPGSTPEFRRSSRMVEPDGIEPTTSCLQSTRSPN